MNTKKSESSEKMPHIPCINWIRTALHKPNCPNRWDNLNIHVSDRLLISYNGSIYFGTYFEELNIWNIEGMYGGTPEPSHFAYLSQPTNE